MDNTEITTSITAYIHAMMRLGIGAKQALTIWRAIGGNIRDQTWFQLWQGEQDLFEQWSAERRAN